MLLTVSALPRTRPRLSYKHESEPFPSFLAPFSLKDPRDYVEELNRSFCYFGDPEDEAAFRFQPGNWLRRWQVRRGPTTCRSACARG